MSLWKYPFKCHQLQLVPLVKHSFLSVYATAFWISCVEIQPRLTSAMSCLCFCINFRGVFVKANDILIGWCSVPCHYWWDNEKRVIQHILSEKWSVSNPSSLCHNTPSHHLSSSNDEQHKTRHLHTLTGLEAPSASPRSLQNQLPNKCGSLLLDCSLDFTETDLILSSCGRFLLL